MSASKSGMPGARLQRRIHRLNVLIYPCKDLAGQWGAHCLELDILSQGDSPGHAVESIAGAIEAVAMENVRDGKFPLEFCSAPKEDWDRLAGAEEVTVRLIRIPSTPISDDVTIAPYQISRAG